MNSHHQAFVSEKSCAAMLFVATWARCTEIRRRFNEAAQHLSDRVNFCEVDADAFLDIAHELKIKTVPTIAYFRDARLVGTIVGEYQEVTKEVMTLLEGDSSWVERRKILSIFR
jgi:thioredoxin-like negative regulator of GroEL